MKKFLLLASAAVLGMGAMSAEEVDVTPKAYNFNNATEIPISTYTFTGANINVPVKESITNFDAEYKDGLIVFGGGQYANPAQSYYQNAVAGTNLVDLGGEVGKVFAHVGENCDVAEALKAYNGNDYVIPKAPGGRNWFNMNFFTDPENTPTHSTGYLRIKVVYNIYAPAYSADNVVNKMYTVTNDGGVTPIQDDANDFTPFSIGDCFVEDPETEEMSWDPTRWATYEWTTFCPDDDGDKSFAPLRIKTECSGASNAALFIKEIKITLVEGETLENPEAGKRVRDFITLTPGKPGEAGIDAVEAAEAATVRVNGNVASFSAPAEVYNLTGAKVAAGTEVTLTAGIYVARVGAKAVKFIVK